MYTHTKIPTKWRHVVFMNVNGNKVQLHLDTIMMMMMIVVFHKVNFHEKNDKINKMLNTIL